MVPNPSLNLAPFGRWTLRQTAAQRRLALRWLMMNPTPTSSSSLTSGLTSSHEDKMNIEDAILELRKINRPVPKPMRLPTPEEVERAENILGVHFHPDYRTFLLKASDVVFGTKESCTVLGDGTNTDLVEVADAAWNKMELPKQLLPICEDNGDYFCINASGEIIFWSHDGITSEKWPSLADWIFDVWIGGR